MTGDPHGLRTTVFQHNGFEWRELQDSRLVRSLIKAPQGSVTSLKRRVCMEMKHKRGLSFANHGGANQSVGEFRRAPGRIPGCCMRHDSGGWAISTVTGWVSRLRVPS